MQKAESAADEVLTRSVLREELAAFSATIVSPFKAHSDGDLRALVARAVKEALAQSHHLDDGLTRVPDVHPWVTIRPLRHEDIKAKPHDDTTDFERFPMRYVGLSQRQPSAELADGAPSVERGLFYAPLDLQATRRPKSCLETSATALRNAVNSSRFELLSLLLLTINALLIGAETYYMKSDACGGGEASMQSSCRDFEAAELAFCWFFVVEAMLRVYAQGLSLFYAEGWQLNVFDFIIVVLVVCGQTVRFFNEAAVADVMNILAFLRLLRIIRVARLFRAAQLSEDFQRLLSSIGSSFASLCWVFILLGCLIYLFSVFFTLMALDYASPDHPDYDKLMHKFGAIHVTALTLFAAIFGGSSWDEDVKLLIHVVSPRAALVMLFYIGFCYTTLLNLITGVFVEKALKSGKEAEERLLCTTVANLFFDPDRDNDRQISAEIFEAKLSDPSMQAYLKAIDISPAEAEHLFELLDTNHSNSIDVAEIINGLLRLKGPAGALEMSLVLREMAHLVDRVEHRICSRHKAPFSQRI
eukprot:TRINITY_DN11999_c0_g1_i4.p1 TRINITY_DN11999_c0_g1~~TRINITY_DN11999_c0_g1_i4.p1  ORF type:complete len:529 (-),score=85.85 TRINITY_DN11999_c0_g1_i4:163-1749(-)